jgi:hypothetical protein
MKKPREVTEGEAKEWFKIGLPVCGVMSLLTALRGLKSQQSLSQLIESTRELINDPVLKDPQTASGHFAKLLEATVWRFQLLVNDGVFDEVLPRLSGLPMLYSPENDKGAKKWLAARNLFHSKKVGTDAFSTHRGLESALTRRIDFGITASHAAHLLHYASLEFPELKKLREKASAVWMSETQGKKGAELVIVRWYHCGDAILRWPIWLDSCEGLPSRRLDAPARYRSAADGLLNEFFATPDNEIAESMAGMPASDQGYSNARAESKRRILDALDRL